MFSELELHVLLRFHKQENRFS